MPTLLLARGAAPGPCQQDVPSRRPSPCAEALWEQAGDEQHACLLAGVTSEPFLAPARNRTELGATCRSDDRGVSQKGTEATAAESSPVCPAESPIEGLWLPRGRAVVGQQQNTVPSHAPCPMARLPLNRGDL